MSFRFRKTDETVEAALRRIACEQIDAALAAVRAEDLPRDKMIHEVRRRCKALRALIRLLRSAFPAYDHENAAFRDIARALSGLRDKAVLADTLALLTDDLDGVADGQALATLRRRFTRGGASAAKQRETIERCAEQLLAARVRAATWMLVGDGQAALAHGFARTARAARRAMRTFSRTGEAELGHEWRKQVKYHWQHLRLLRGIAPGAEDRAEMANRLGDLLGDRHDLDLFVAALPVGGGRTGNPATIARLSDAAHKRAAKLEKKALRIGGRLFDEKPARLASRLGEMLKEQSHEMALT